jgi:hypothetical protein
MANERIRELEREKTELEETVVGMLHYIIYLESKLDIQFV